jgi:hypothetical protein
MAALTPPWDQYLAVQANLGTSRTIDDVSWGREAQLNRLLAATTGLAPDELERVGQSESRRERHRARLRRMHSSEVHFEGEALVHARDHLRLIKSGVAPKEWDLLAGIGSGVTYSELAASTGAKEGALRVRIARVRQRLRSIAA